MQNFYNIVKNSALLAIIAIGFFIVGFSLRDARAASLNPQKIRTALIAIPDRLEMLLDQPEPSKDTLPVRKTYQDTLNTIVDRFYSEASTTASTVVKTPTNTVTPSVTKQEPSLDTMQLTYMAIRGILASLEDPFTGFLDPADYKKMREESEGNFVGIGAQLWTNKKGQVYVKEPLPDCPAIKAGVRKGDIIMRVDDKSVVGMEIDDVVKLIRGPEGTKVTLTLSRGDAAKPVKMSIVRKLVDYHMVEYAMVDKANGIGWLQLRQFNSKADTQMDDALTKLEEQHMKGLILDLRGNPGGLLESAVDIGSRFIKSGPVVIIQERGGERKRLEVDPSKHDHKAYPLVVLVDGMSASASEIVAGAIKDDHAGVLVGEKTFGKGRVQTIVPMPGDGAVRITTAKYLTPNGVDIHKKGIEPDIVVKQPDEDEDYEPGQLKNNPQLQKAVEVLREKLVSSGTKNALSTH